MSDNEKLNEKIDALTIQVTKLESNINYIMLKNEKREKQMSTIIFSAISAIITLIVSWAMGKLGIFDGI